MRIHLTDCTTNKGQLDLLRDENYVNHLASFAYPTMFKPNSFPWLWEEQLRIHLAATGPKFLGDCLAQESTATTLMSYAYKQDEQTIYTQPWESTPSRVIIDSGAFTAHSSGKVIKPQEYGAWALDLKRRWGGKLAELYFMNLDVIGDQEASWVNQRILERMGLEVIPIITYKAEKDNFTKALDNYPYIAFGGLHDPKTLKQWLDYCFGIVMNHYKKTGVMPKTHLLGQTKDWVLQRYPCFSSDSSTWVSCLRFGRGGVVGIQRIPRYKEGEGAMAATLTVLRAEIRKYKKMEADATKLWESRGIRWDTK